MRFTLLIFSIFPIVCSAQNFQPLNGEVSKRFFDVNEPSNADYFFHATSEEINGDEISWSQYYTTQSDVEVEEELTTQCFFWGGGSNTTLDTTWLGNTIYYNQNSFELHLTNENSEILNFNFGLDLNDSSMFYQNSSSSWYIRLVSQEEQDVFGQLENMKHFEVTAYDADGLALENDLTGFHIELSENLGLLTFIDCYHFPEVNTGLQLRGQTNPLFGDYQLSYLQAYPWQPGDVIQYLGAQSFEMGAYVNRTYQTLTITNRIETADSVFIYYESDIQQVNETPFGGSTILFPITNPVAFNKNACIVNAPINMAPQGIFHEYSENDLIDMCHWSGHLEYEEFFSMYCDSCLCFGAFDGFNTTLKRKRYAINRGQISHALIGYGPLENQNFPGRSQIYSSIGGVECGNLYVGIDEQVNNQMQLYPNPTSGLLNVSLSERAELMWLTDIHGRIVHQKQINQEELSQINLESLQSGSYILFVRFFDGAVVRKMVVVN
jgi:hypothetical protein